MIKKLTFLLSLAGGMCLAQQKSAAVIVVGRVLNEEDSAQVRESYFSGLQAKTSNKLNESEGYFKQVIALDPANHAALYELACLYYGQDEPTLAEKYARDAVTVNPDNKWYWLLLADIYKKTNNINQLGLVYTDLIRLEPQNQELYFYKANTLYLANKTKEAESFYNEIEKKFGTSNELIDARQRMYQKGGSPQKAAVELEKLISANPLEVRNYLNLSDLYEKAGQLDKALDILLRAKQAGAVSPFVNLALADIYNAQEKKDQALAELKAAFASPGLNVDAKVGIIMSFFPHFKDADAREQAMELGKVVVENHPLEAKAFTVYGDVLYQHGKLNEAKAAYKKAIELNSETYQTWEHILRIEVATHDFSSLIADGEEALTFFPNQGTLYFFTAIGYAKIARHEKAVSYLKSAADLISDDKEFQSQIYASLGDSYHTLKQFTESDAAYNKALELNPQNTYVLNNYAYYLSLRGENLAKAAEMSARSNQLQFGNASFEDTYAWVLFKQKKYADACNWIQKAIKSNTGSGVLVEHYGDILFHMGNNEQALQQWIKAKEMGVKTNILDKKINEKKYIE